MSGTHFGRQSGEQRGFGHRHRSAGVGREMPHAVHISGSIIIPMRRIVAMLLLAVFGVAPLSPVVFASDAVSKLPPCCRRDGKHHCSMAANGSGASSGPSLRAARCAFFPAAPATPSSPTAGPMHIAMAGFARIVSHPAPPSQIQAICRSSYSRAGQKRGPPSPLS